MAMAVAVQDTPQPAAAPSGPAAGAKAGGDTKTASDCTRRFAQECAVCQGANGRSDQSGVPVLAGQPSL